MSSDSISHTTNAPQIPQSSTIIAYPNTNGFADTVPLPLTQASNPIIYVDAEKVGEAIGRVLEKSLKEKATDPTTPVVSAVQPEAASPVFDKMQAIKFEPEEVNYRKGDALRCCANCHFYMGEGEACAKVDASVQPDMICDMHEASNMKSLGMIITKASVHNGERRWAATASDTDPDKQNEACSLDLFKGFVEMFTKSATKPFLGVAHYPRLNGVGVAGTVESLYIDGKKLKAKGTFADTPLGDAVFKTVYEDRSSDRQDKTRISLAWYDLKHSHGEDVFTRKSLSDTCPLCAEKKNINTYLYGFLDHLAATRVPVNSRTELQLEMKSMITRKDDATSIIGEELAAELEKAAKEAQPQEKAMVVRSTVLPAEAFALVPDVNKSDTWKVQIWEDAEKKATLKQLSLAAESLTALSDSERAEAIKVIRSHYLDAGVKPHAFPEAVRPEFPVVVADWDAFADGVTRLSSDPLTAGYIKSYVQKFKSVVFKDLSEDLHAIDAALDELSDESSSEDVDVEKSEYMADADEDEMNELYLDTDDPFDRKLISFKSQVEDIKAGETSEAEKSNAIKEAFTKLGEDYVSIYMNNKSASAEVAPPASALDMNMLSAAINSAMSPVLAQIGAMNERINALTPAQAQAEESTPARKSVAVAKSNTQTPNAPKSVSEIVRRSLIG